MITTVCFTDELACTVECAAFTRYSLACRVRDALAGHGIQARIHNGRDTEVSYTGRRAPVFSVLVRDSDYPVALGIAQHTDLSHFE